MIAYKAIYLDNREVREQADEALSKKIITQEESDLIYGAYPYNLYTPNFFVRIGLFLLTVLALLCGLGLFMLVSENDRSMGSLFIFFGFLSYGALELFLHVRGFYKAGVDDALLLIAGLMVVIGINILSPHTGPIMESGMILVLAFWGFVR